jgi:hypothetical protein
LLIVASAGFGCHFAWTQGAYHGPVLAAFAVAMALGLELAKPFAIEGVFSCLRNWAIGRASAMALLAIVAVGYSLTAELSLMAMTRGDAAAERMKVSGATKDDRAELTRLLAERSAMAFIAATADMVMAAREAVAAAERTRKAECGDGNVKQRGANCRAREADEGAARQKLSEATANKAATDRAAKLDAEAATVRARLAEAPATSVADPGASALAGYLRLFGVNVPATTLAEALVLVGVVALEAGSSLAVVLVRAVSAGHQAPSRPLPTYLPEVSGRTAPPPTQSQPALPDTKPTGKPNDDGSRPRGKRPKMPAKGRTPASKRRLGNVVRLVQREGGHLKAGQRELAKRLKLSKSRTHELLKEAAAAGMLRVETSKQGTSVALAG